MLTHLEALWPEVVTHSHLIESGFKVNSSLGQAEDTEKSKAWCCLSNLIEFRAAVGKKIAHVMVSDHFECSGL
jgi:hypothetical protein